MILAFFGFVCSRNIASKLNQSDVDTILQADNHLIFLSSLHYFIKMNVNPNIFKVFFFCSFVTLIYSILQDQIAFSISPDYFYRYSFYQYGFAHEGTEWIPNNTRLELAKLSLSTSWWISILAGLIITFPIYIFRDKYSAMGELQFSFILGITIVILTTIFGAIVGYYSDSSSISEHLPLEHLNTIELQYFLVAKYMGLYSYLGGALGVLTASILCFLKLRKKG